MYRITFAALAATLSLATPAAAASPRPLSSQAVSTVLSVYKPGLDACYARQVKRGARGLPATARAKFSVRADGTVARVRVGVRHRKLKRCLTTKLSSWRFPAADGNAVRVSLPLVFRS